MNMQKQILYIYAETPIHVGTGTGLGVVDMPIQREKHTGYPIIQASGVKGALRDTIELALGRESQIVKYIFGGATGDNGADFAGAISPSDARVLLFPVRALKGVFVWVTSPTVLGRFKQETGLHDAPLTPNDDDGVLVSHPELLTSGQIMLEEYTYAAEGRDLAWDWADYLANYALHGEANDYWKERLRSHFVILPDNEFRDFVRYSTDIVTRIHIDDVKKTVKDGQLFTQELLPSDSLLYSFVHITDSRNGEADEQRIISQKVVDVLQQGIGDRLQIGGDETVGRGRVRLNWQEAY